MKKQLKKKLVFNKSTVSNLSPGEMREAFAGEDAASKVLLSYCQPDCTVNMTCGNTVELAAMKDDGDNYLR